MAPDILSRQRLLIITYPRTASNLLMQILNMPEQPNTLCEENGGYFFLPALLRMRQLGMMERPYSEWSQEQRSEIQDLFQDCFDKLQAQAADAQAAGKRIVAKEHAPAMIDPLSLMRFGSTQQELALMPDGPWKIQLPDEWSQAKSLDCIMDDLFCNDTVLPNAFLMTWLPTFLIRNPIVAFPSYYRVFHSARNAHKRQMKYAKGQMNRTMTMRWTRRLYDWYMNIWQQQKRCKECQQGPVILDADDILTSPEELKKYCRLVGLDETKLQFSWKPLSEEEVAKCHPLKQRMRDTLHASSGIQKDKLAGDRNLETELVEWKDEFGEEEGLQLREWVVAAMPDYVYLRDRRLQL
ncbi:uncharacterized protein N7473_000990 [Penicillium subrubescens]|uniref:Uncharacterized protein n=1 Tax=Penicillium subrubescens TaxID=1316194 RepID=A0A1Q5UP70_9EURO|nr:uncharacterized protein N7473_000990 [Penicillium subrubescens]KAJ5911687.1 hypothetical protein N7473_000990 [Penicillium subrubescens]OKP14272.1 hypothetical protein PENSUB_35 [Penicillium subrubescens]